MRSRVDLARARGQYFKYIVSFLGMILFTIASFWLIAYKPLSGQVTFWLITFFAAVQVVLQLFTFMHLDQKGQGVIILFMLAGLIIAVVSAVGIIFM